MKRNNIWDAPVGTTNRGYNHLPVHMLDDWATRQAKLSEDYKKGFINGVSATDDGRKRKQDMVNRIKRTLIRHSSFTSKEMETRLAQVEQYLEDPGLLLNFEYFDIPSSDFMLQFYFAVWDRRIAEVMGYLHNYGKDLKGNIRRVNDQDVWYIMSKYEGMNINERKKARDVVEFIKTHNITHATSFGGGNIPERLYGLPKNLKLIVFDDGPVSPLKDLFPDRFQRDNVTYISQRLSMAPLYKQYLNTQGLVWMHGVSMYLNEKDRHEMTGAILCGAAILKPGGFMKYDYLVWTESMRRVISTQCWPYNPEDPMVIFKNANEAIQQGRNTLDAVNTQLGGKAYMDALDPEVTLIEPWGVTSVRFTVQKHV